MTACKATSCTGTPDRVAFTYDGDGHRIRIVETPASGTPTTTDFAYEGDTVVRETATTRASVVTRTFTADEAGAIVTMTIATSPSAGTDDGTYLVTWNGHGDAIGLAEISPTDGSLIPAATVTYATWGTPTVSPQPGYGNLGFRYLYVGRFDVQWDDFAGAGLLYMHARHYSPEFGRFLTPDPSALEANLYGYAENSPVTKVDPSGTVWWFVLAAIAVRALATRVATAVVTSAAASSFPSVRDQALPLLTAIQRTPLPSVGTQAARLTYIASRHAASATFPGKSRFLPQYFRDWGSTNYLLDGLKRYAQGYTEIAARSNGYTVVTVSKFPNYMGYLQNGQPTKWVTAVWKDGYLWNSYPGLPSR